jgi:hypothetical protein
MEVLHQERTFSMVAIRLTNEGQQRAKLAEQGKCLGCEQPAESSIRGLCNACYQAMRRAIAKKQTSEQQLIKTGRLLQRAPKGRPLSNPLAKQLAEK